MASAAGRVVPPPMLDLPAELPPPVDPALDIARAVRGGAPAGDQIERALGRIALLDPRINAFVWVDPATARDGVAAAERERRGPLAGVPIAHKDILWTADAPTTAGSALLRGYRPPRDAEVVARLRRAGAVSIGKLNTHEFATGITGRVSAFGPTLNPRAKGRLAGGSSCGSAAAVAAGMIAGATATDTGGSIRIPAACCGVVGFKPTFGAVPVDGVIPFAWSLDHVGAIASDVTDVALLHAVMAGDDKMLADGFDEGVLPPLGALRFGVADAWLSACDAPVAGAVEDLADALVAAGARRVGGEIPPLAGAPAIAGAVFLAEGGWLHAETLRRRPEAYCEETREFLALAAGVTDADYELAQRLRLRLAAGFSRALQSIDLLIAPVLPTTAPPIDAAELDLPDRRLDVRAALTRFTRPFNLTGQPALCLPIGRDSAGLPIAAQLVGKREHDASLLRWARLIERTIGK